MGGSTTFSALLGVSVNLLDTRWSSPPFIGLSDIFLLHHDVRPNPVSDPSLLSPPTALMVGSRLDPDDFV